MQQMGGQAEGLLAAIGWKKLPSSVLQVSVFKIAGLLLANRITCAGLPIPIERKWLEAEEQIEALAQKNPINTHYQFIQASL